MPPGGPAPGGAIPAGAFTIDAGHPALPGHFPGRPIVPGVMLLDHAAALILATLPGRTLSSFPAVRFTRPVRPGEAVTVEHEAGRFTCRVDGAVVCSGTIAFA